jgi:hypothetical protein
MRYFKVMNSAGEIVAVEQHENPTYFRWQVRNSIKILCSETLAQGVVSLDGSTVYQLEGRDALPLKDLLTAAMISQVDYEALLNEVEDPEDSTPVIPEHVDETMVLTRAQLTEKVNELSEAIDLLLSGVTE